MRGRGESRLRPPLSGVTRVIVRRSLVRRVVSRLFARHLWIVACLVVAPPATVAAQTPMSIIGVAAPEMMSYDENNGVAWFNVNFTVKNTGSQAAYVYAWQDCGPWCGSGGPWHGVYTYLT